MASGGSTFKSEFQQLGQDLKRFIETRYEILCAELSTTLASLRTSAILLGVAVIFAVPAVILLGICISLAIAFGLGAIPAQAGLIGGFLVTGACGLVIAIITGAIGVSRLKDARLTPRHTLRVLRRDGESFRNGGERYVDEPHTRRRA